MPTRKRTATKNTASAKRRSTAAPPKPVEEIRPATPPPIPPEEEWTVNGNAIPVEYRHAIPFANTDQGHKFAQAKLAAEGKLKGPKVEMISDEFDRQIEHRSDAAEGDAEPWSAPDPLLETVDGVREPGMAYRYLSDTLNERRGRRGFEIVKKANGDPVKVANLVLGKMPKERAAQRRRHYQNIGNDAIRESEEHYVEQQEKLVRDRGAVGISPLTPGESLRDTRDGTRTASVGLQQQRGNSHFPDEAA